MYRGKIVEKQCLDITQFQVFGGKVSRINGYGLYDRYFRKLHCMLK